MKKVLVVFLLVIAAVSWIGCFAEKEEKEDEKEVAYINFSNESDANITYGIRFGSAEWDISLAADSNTWSVWGEDGKKVEAGSYYVETKGADGVWSNASTDTITIEKDHYYDVVLLGTLAGGLSWGLYDWDAEAYVKKSAGDDSETKDKKQMLIFVQTVKATIK